MTHFGSRRYSERRWIIPALAGAVLQTTQVACRSSPFFRRPTLRLQPLCIGTVNVLIDLVILKSNFSHTDLV